MKTAVDKSVVIKEYRRNEQDTGSPEVQVALLTERIEQIRQHLSEHKHDNSNRRGLLQLISNRRRVLSYIRTTDEAKHGEIIAKLGIRA